MRALSLTQADATRLSQILSLFNAFKTKSIQGISLKMDNIYLEWNKDTVHLIFEDPPPTDDSKEV